MVCPMFPRHALTETVALRRHLQQLGTHPAAANLTLAAAHWGAEDLCQLAWLTLTS